MQYSIEESALIGGLIAEYFSRASVLTQVQGTIQFEDDEKISNWAKESVHALASLGVIQGTSQSNFEPQREVSFEQMLVLSYRCFSIFKT